MFCNFNTIWFLDPINHFFFLFPSRKRVVNIISHLTPVYHFPASQTLSQPPCWTDRKKGLLYQISRWRNWISVQLFTQTQPAVGWRQSQEWTRVFWAQPAMLLPHLYALAVHPPMWTSLRLCRVVWATAAKCGRVKWDGLQVKVTKALSASRRATSVQKSR